MLCQLPRVAAVRIHDVDVAAHPPVAPAALAVFKSRIFVFLSSDLALKAPQELFKDVSRLTSRDASRHASMPLTH